MKKYLVYKPRLRPRIYAKASLPFAEKCVVTAWTDDIREAKRYHLPTAQLVARWNGCHVSSNG